MDYNHITIFLEKFKKIVFKKEEIRDIVIKIILSEVPHEIQKDSIKIKNGLIYIQGSPILRNEIMIHKNQILNKLKIALPSDNFLDIK